MMKNSTIAISEFKAKCLRLLDEVGEKGHTLVITKKGRAIARVVPVSPPKRSLRGSWRGIVQLKGDIVRFDTSEEWEALG
jgi:prevent-host-death family protein